jgi:general secretion pathway protein N
MKRLAALAERVRSWRPVGRRATRLSGFESSMLGQEGFDRARRTTRRWAYFGAAIGALCAAFAFAPASWMAQAVASASNGHLQLTESRGTVWSGSAVMVLTGGTGSRDAMALPGRLSWRLGWSGLAPQLRFEQACCLNGRVGVNLEPGLGQVDAELVAPPGWVAQWPTAWLAGLGTPFNTMQLGGAVRFVSPGLTVRWVAGRWQMDGRAEIEFNGVSSRLSTLESLGSYRLSLVADPANAGNSLLTLTTVDGALQLSGNGTWSASGLRFRGEARSGLANDAALNNLLNIIGRREGARSLISIG